MTPLDSGAAIPLLCLAGVVSSVGAHEIRGLAQVETHVGLRSDAQFWRSR